MQLSHFWIIMMQTKWQLEDCVWFPTQNKISLCISPVLKIASAEYIVSLQVVKQASVFQYVTEAVENPFRKKLLSSHVEVFFYRCRQKHQHPSGPVMRTRYCNAAKLRAYVWESVSQSPPAETCRVCVCPSVCSALNKATRNITVSKPTLINMA